MEMGLSRLKKLGFASFCSPAYRHVAPRKRRRGTRAHSLSAHARTGALKGRRRSGPRPSASPFADDTSPSCHRSSHSPSAPHFPVESFINDNGRRDERHHPLVSARENSEPPRIARVWTGGPSRVRRGRTLHWLRLTRRN